MSFAAQTCDMQHSLKGHFLVSKRRLIEVPRQVYESLPANDLSPNRRLGTLAQFGTENDLTQREQPSDGPCAGKIMEYHF